MIESGDSYESEKASLTAKDFEMTNDPTPCDKAATEKIGRYSRYNNGDKSMSVYRDGEFIAAIENDTASCRLFYLMANEIQSLEAKLAICKEALKIYSDAHYNRAYTSGKYAKEALAQLEGKAE